MLCILSETYMHASGMHSFRHRAGHAGRRDALPLDGPAVKRGWIHDLGRVLRSRRTGGAARA